MVEFQKRHAQNETDQAMLRERLSRLECAQKDASDKGAKVCAQKTSNLRHEYRRRSPSRTQFLCVAVAGQTRAIKKEKDTLRADIEVLKRALREANEEALVTSKEKESAVQALKTCRRQFRLLESEKTKQDEKIRHLQQSSRNQTEAADVSLREKQTTILQLQADLAKSQEECERLRTSLGNSKLAHGTKLKALQKDDVENNQFLVRFMPNQQEQKPAPIHAFSDREDTDHHNRPLPNPKQKAKIVHDWYTQSLPVQHTKEQKLWHARDFETDKTPCNTRKCRGKAGTLVNRPNRTARVRADEKSGRLQLEEKIVSLGPIFRVSERLPSSTKYGLCKPNQLVTNILLVYNTFGRWEEADAGKGRPLRSVMERCRGFEGLSVHGSGSSAFGL
ncbi:hypothetical protein HK102_009384 [Quaeritorhiza haematococci]|nr:hypothetical protein HK102_009384 [Quaeritorhiza haematococci]